MPTRWDINAAVTVVNLMSSVDEDGGTSVSATEFDIRDYGHEARFLLVLDCEGNTSNTGGTWSVGESATSGGGVTAATTVGSLAATGASEAAVQRVVSLRPNSAKPFVTVKFTDADANTDATLHATLIAIPNVL